MKTRLPANLSIALILVISILANNHGTSAQSGRKVPPPPPASPDKPDAPPAFVPDPNGDEYKLAFAKSYQDKFLGSPKDRKEKNNSKRQESETMNEDGKITMIILLNKSI